MHDSTGSHRSRVGPPAWCREAVIYRIDVRSFRDSDGDGVGDLNGVRDRMGYLELLGADIISLAGVPASPHGEPGKGRDVDPLLGDLASFEMLVAEAHASGLRVSIDAPVHRYAIETPGARDAIEKSVGAWMQRGVDAFTVGVTPGMTNPLGEAEESAVSLLRAAVDTHPGRAIGSLVDERFPDHPGLHDLDVASDFRFRNVGFAAEDLRAMIGSILTAFENSPSRPGWIIAGWNEPRPASRYGSGAAGRVRARAMALLQLALPGVITLDSGDELGLPDSVRTDRFGQHADHGRIPWEDADPTFGFTDSSGVSPAEPTSAASLTVQNQLEDPESTLSLFRRAIEIRRRFRHAATDDTVEWYGAPEGCLAFRRSTSGITCALNTGSEPVPLPPGRVLLASRPVDASLPPETAVWLASSDRE